jgi:serine/threonine-protein kinase
VTGESIDQARAALDPLGFTVVVEEQFVDDQGAGTVVSQAPPVGQKLKEGKPVTLVVSKGPTPVDPPDLTGKTQDEATAALEGVGLKVGEVAGKFDESTDAGDVLDWEPKSGTRKGDAVNLVVSKGPALRTIPVVTTMTYEQAAKALQDLGLAAARDERYDDEVPEGKIIGTRPPAGYQVERGSTVTVVLSKGRPAVPNLSGKTEAEAKAALEAVDLRLGAVYGPSGGHVVLITPGAGTRVARGSTVSIYLI